MNITPFFRDLRNSYQAEIDDMTFDSEGQDVLRQRLAERRKEMDFLVHMMEPSPEMVAVVFHQGFRFKHPAVMEHLLTQHSDELPAWDALSSSIELMPWAQELAGVALKQPTGDWFLTVSAGLEYMYHRHDSTLAAASQSDDEDNEEEENAQGHADYAGDDRPDPVDSDDAHDAKAREEAGADWMVEQGFDRKD
jgi:preprotein translocase subunit SecA